MNSNEMETLRQIIVKGSNTSDPTITLYHAAGELHKEQLPLPLKHSVIHFSLQWNTCKFIGIF